jgi:starch-binding outer membrane protein, SusD/RagB family
MKKLIISLSLITAIIAVSCKKTFTVRPSLDTPTVDNYYNNAEQVRGATGTLYGLSWFDYIDKALDCIGEVRSGNEVTWDGAYTSFQNPRLGEAWRAFYKSAGWATVMIKTFEYKKSSGVTGAFLDQGIAEARFMRGVAYFYIGRIWGDAPIVADPGALAETGNYQVPRYFQKDVLRFALEDFKFAEANLPETDVPGRVTRYSAKGMMAKLYLYRKDYDSARTKALEVMNSGRYDLISDYAGMFNTKANNNNKETLFSLQHAITNEWGSQNSLQAYRAPGNLLVTGDGWSSVVPSIDLVNSYESGDLRRRWSIIEHGDHYPQWKPQRENSPAYNAFMAGGYRYDTLQPAPMGVNKTQSRTHIAKYLVGPGGAFGGDPLVQSQKTEINTYILRYADVLLIYAESVLGNAASTSEATALAAFNKVRARAGLLPKTSITKDDILRERRSEFAFEGDYWFDIQRQGFARAKQIIEAQERGSINDNGPITSVKVTFNENQMYLPFPIGETVQNPKLLEPAVSYY